MGYDLGWRKVWYAVIRRKAVIEKSQRRRFGEFFDQLEDKIFANKK